MKATARGFDGAGRCAHTGSCNVSTAQRKSTEPESVNPRPTFDSISGKEHGSNGAIVMGANYRALGAVRSLGRRGIHVCVLKAEGELLAAFSRYARCSQWWHTGEDSERLKSLFEIARNCGFEGWVLFPTGDEDAAFVARHYDVLSGHFQLTTPAWETLRWAYDKRLTWSLANRLDIAQPWAICPSCRSDLRSAGCPFPVILKPAFKQNLNRFTSAKAWRVDDLQSLLTRYDEACALVDPDAIMIQEHVPGSGESQFSYAAVCKDGQPLAWIVARRTRQIPMDFGRFSTYVESIDEPAVVEPSVRLIRAMGFTGILEVEFKRDPRDGGYKLLDINPRLWGWHTLGAREGIDFVYLLWLMVHGKPVPHIRAPSGLRWRISTDFPVAIGEILKGRLPLGTYARSFFGSHECAIFAPDDPLPGLLELPLLAHRLVKRALTS
jgi:D-aspartate ligase